MKLSSVNLTLCVTIGVAKDIQALRAAVLGLRHC